MEIPVLQKQIKDQHIIMEIINKNKKQNRHSSK